MIFVGGKMPWFEMDDWGYPHGLETSIPTAAVLFTSPRGLGHRGHWIQHCSECLWQELPMESLGKVGCKVPWNREVLLAQGIEYYIYLYLVYKNTQYMSEAPQFFWRLRVTQNKRQTMMRDCLSTDSIGIFWRYHPDNSSVTGSVAWRKYSARETMNNIVTCPS